MIVPLMSFCAVGAILLIGLGVYAEFEELSTHSGKHRVDGGPSTRPHHH